MSKSFELDREDYTRIIRTTLIIYTPVVLLFLDQIQSWEFNMSIIYAATLSITIDSIRRYFTNYTKQ